MTDSISSSKPTDAATDSSAKTALPRRVPPHETEKWNGYTVDELRYQRAYTLARIEINNHRLKQQTSSLVGGGPTSSRHLVGRVLSAFSYVDLALLAWRIGSKVWQTSKIIRR